MTAIELIERKRDGGTLTSDEIGWLIRHYTDGSVTDYQMSAMLMAVFLNGLNDTELTAWVDAMLHSGEVLDLSGISLPKSDKHSTGGVGDKVSIPLAPMVAACGVAIPMMSGRGLGHTGGTLDKLESIPGFTTGLDPATFTRILSQTGLVLAGQSETLVPADRKLYALRDATATVPSVPLIASSIMSKKLAEDLDGLVLDVKVGRGAFMGDPEQATYLAEMMVSIGRAHGLQVVALLTDMNQPLGCEVGNANEIRESLEVLEGGGPEDLREVVLRLAEEMLCLAGVAVDQDEARRCLEASIESGAATRKFGEVIAAQGGDAAVIANPSLLPAPSHVDDLPATRSGFVTKCDAYAVGTAAVRLGAGRETKEDDIDPAVGITVLKKEGDAVAEGEPLARVGWNEPARFEAALSVLTSAWDIGDQPPAPRPLILGDVR